MQLGKCSSCGTRAELHEDVDGSWVCENCKIGGTPLGNKVEKRISENQEERTIKYFSPSPSVPGPRRETLIDFIVANASDEWIQNFISRRLSALQNRLGNSNGWIDEVLAEPEERKLLRMAVELGYRISEPAKKTAEPNKKSSAKFNPVPPKLPTKKTVVGKVNAEKPPSGNQ